MSTKKKAGKPLMEILTKREKGDYLPAFTPDELRCIHRDIFTSAYQGSVFYNERRALLRKLDAYFGDDRAHLGGKNL